MFQRIFRDGGVCRTACDIANAHEGVIFVAKDVITTQDTNKYRCIVYQRRLTDDLYLSYCGVENCMPGYRFDTEGRTGYHLHVILKGKGTLYVDGAGTDLHFGQMFITKPGEDSWYVADKDDPWVYCWMTFDGEKAGSLAEKAGFFKGVNYQDCHIDPQHFYALVNRVLDWPEVSPANLLLRTGIMMEYLSLAIESYSKSTKGLRRSHEYPTDMYVRYAADFIRENSATAKIGDVARYIGIHRSYLTNIFKSKMGVSPQEYLMQCKLKLASDLLINTDNPIQEISRMVGYDNPLTFSKTFKTFYGLSPKNYRLYQKTESASASEPEQ